MRSSSRVALLTFASKLAGYVLAAATSVLLARWLSPEDRGLWAVAVLVSGLMALVSETGIGTSMLHRLRMREFSPAALVTTGLVIVIASSVTGSAGVLALMRAGLITIEGVSPAALCAALAAAVFVVVSSVGRSTLLGLGDAAGSNLSMLSHAVGVFLLLSAALLLMRGGVEGALAAYALAAAATAAFTVVRLWRLHGIRWSWRGDLLRPLASYGLRSHLASLAFFLVCRFDLLVVNHYLGLRAAGIYSIALSLSEVLRGVPETAQAVVLSRAASRDLLPLSLQVSRIATPSTLVLGTLLAASSHWLVPFVFGPDYAPASGAFWWLLPGMLGLALSYSLSPLLSLSGAVHVSVWAAVWAFAAMLVIDMGLVPRFGIGGAALGSSIAYWLLAAIQVGGLRARGTLRLRQLLPRPADYRPWVPAA